MKMFRHRRLLRQIIKANGADKLFYTYFFYFLFSAILIQMVEPSIQSIGDSFWYCFAVATTVGFGDYSAVTMPGRIITVILSIYSIAAVAVFTALIAGYFMDVVRNNAKQSAAKFLDDLEHLPDMSQEEIKDLSARIRKFRKSL